MAGTSQSLSMRRSAAPFARVMGIAAALAVSSGCSSGLRDVLGTGDGGSDGGGSGADGGTSGGDGGTAADGGPAVPNDGGTDGVGVIAISAGKWTWKAALASGAIKSVSDGVFVDVAGLATATGVGQGVNDGSSCAVLADKTVKCWGSNAFGQLGNGSTTDSATPVSVQGLSSVREVALGDGFACALLDDGSVKCWGKNTWGQTGSGSWVTIEGFGGAVSGPESCSGGSVPCAKTPVAVPGITGATSVTASSVTACAVVAGGNVMCWGSNIGALLGNGTDTGPIRSTVAALSIAPVQVQGVTNATKVSAEWFHACAVITGGAIKCWGSNNFGELGIGSATGPNTCTANTMTIGGPNCAMSAVQVSDISTARDVAVSSQSTCAALENGTVRCWGRNELGELGTGNVTDSAVPVQATGISSATAVEGGIDYFLARLSDGTVLAWGGNTNKVLALPGVGNNGGPDECGNYGGYGGASCSKTPRLVDARLWGGTNPGNAGGGADGGTGGGSDGGTGGGADGGAAAACSMGTITGSCMLSSGVQCTEYNASTAAGGQLGCSMGGSGTWSAAPCTATNKLGGCRTSLAGVLCQSVWYYSVGGGATLDQAKASCSAGSGVWVDP